MISEVYKNLIIRPNDNKIIIPNGSVSFHNIINNSNVNTIFNSNVVNINTLNSNNILHKTNGLELCSFKNNNITSVIKIQNNNNSCNIQSNLNINNNINFNNTSFFGNSYIIGNTNTDSNNSTVSNVNYFSKRPILGDFTIKSTYAINQAPDYAITNYESSALWTSKLSNVHHDKFKFKLYHVDTSGRYYVTIENIYNHYRTLFYNIPTLYNIYDISAQGTLNYEGAYGVNDLRHSTHGNLVIYNGFIYHKYSQSFINGSVDSHWNLSDKSLVLYRLTCIDEEHDIFNIEHYSYGYLLQPGWNKTQLNKIDSTNSVQIFWDNNIAILDDTLLNTLFGTGQPRVWNGKTVLNKTEYKRGYYEGKLTKYPHASLDNYYKFKISGLNSMLELQKNDLQYNLKTYLNNNNKLILSGFQLGIGTNHPYANYLLDVNGNLITYTSNNISYLSFTGQHRCFMTEKYDNESIGYIVECNGTYKNLDNTSIPKINEALPIVIFTKKKQSQKIFGVISEYENDSDYRTFANGGFITAFKKNDNRVYINSLGEGSIWIVNTNGNLENGDYIQSSNILGCGEKQDSNALYNYTVAKITCDCNFENDNINYTCIECIDSITGNTYKKAFVGCTYHCG